MSALVASCIRLLPLNFKYVQHFDEGPADLVPGPPARPSRVLRRADSIVRDAELIRRAVVPPGSPSAGRWSLLGQSFGGFCCATYLSLAPEGLVEVLMTGGIPPGITQPCSAEDGEHGSAGINAALPVGARVARSCPQAFPSCPAIVMRASPLLFAAVYRRTFRRCLQQNDKFYQRFPMDVERAQASSRSHPLRCLLCLCCVPSSSAVSLLLAACIHRPARRLDRRLQRMPRSLSRPAAHSQVSGGAAGWRRDDAQRQPPYAAVRTAGSRGVLAPFCWLSSLCLGWASTRALLMQCRTCFMSCCHAMPALVAFANFIPSAGPVQLMKSLTRSGPVAPPVPLPAGRSSCWACRRWASPTALSGCTTCWRRPGMGRS